MSGSTEDDYYSNPATTRSNDSEITSMLQSLGITGPNSTPISATQNNGTSTTTYVSDPFNYEGKIVKFARFYVDNIEIAQHSTMTGFQDYYENGRLMGFSITCNDRDMIPVCYVENENQSKDVINDMSFVENVMHGRGMTLSEAASTIKIGGVDISRDVSGQQLSLFPYITRFKDTYDVGYTDYDMVKGTMFDKTYVMHFEPTVFIPYHRLYFDVANNSSLGPRLVNRLEIKRLIYLDQNTDTTSTDVSTDYTQLDQVLQSLGTQSQSPTPDLQQVATTMLPTKSFGAYSNEDENQYEGLIRYMYNLINNKNVAKIKYRPKKRRILVDTFEEQAERANLGRMIRGEKEKPKQRKKEEEDSTVMRVKFG